MVTGFERGDGWTDFVDDPDTFVPEDTSPAATRKIALEDMQIGPANGRLRDLDDRIGRIDYPWLILVLERLPANAFEYECFHGEFLQRFHAVQPAIPSMQDGVAQFGRRLSSTRSERPFARYGEARIIRSLEIAMFDRTVEQCSASTALAL